MNYAAKRRTKRITFYTMVKELGIDKDKYKEVEQGLRNLEGDLLDKYYNVLDNAKDINMDRKLRMIEINTWFNTHDLAEEVKKMGYKSNQDFAKMARIKPSTFYRVKANPDNVCDDVKEEIYDFLHNYMNKFVDSEPRKEKSKEEEEVKVETPVELEKQEDITVNNTLQQLKTMEDISFVKYLQEENERLKRQVYLYEKLIERL